MGCCLHLGQNEHLKGKETLFDMLTYIAVRNELFPMMKVTLYVACLVFEIFAFKVAI